MVAQRKAISTKTTRATTTPRQRRATAAAAQPRRSASDSGNVDSSRGLYALQAMRADALAWVAEIERRIGELEHVEFRPEGIRED